MAEGAATSSRTNLALGLALGSLVTMLVLGSLDADGPIWLLQGVLAAGAIFFGWTSKAGAKLEGRPLVAVVAGVLLLIAFAIGTIVELA